MVLYNVSALADVLKVKNLIFILGEPFDRPDVIPRVHDGAVIESDGSLWGLDHFDSDSRVKRRVRVGEE